MTYLLIFTIGPVQSFIASSRKTQDLFAGSAILSQLVICAYKRLEKEITPATAQLVFPTLDANSKDATNPNRFAALIEDFDGDLGKIIKQVKDAVVEIDFVQTALAKLEEYMPDGESLHPTTEHQLRNLPEIFWAAIELENKQEDFVKKYALLESSLGGIKNIRNLKQLKEAGRKCNVDGVHNVIVYRKAENGENTYKLHLDANSNPVNVIDKDDEAYAKIWELSPGEGLSAVSFYKRRFLPEINEDEKETGKAYQIAHKYPSTARIALMHLLEKQVVKDLPEFKEYELMLSIKKNEKDEKAEDTAKRIFTHSDDQLFYEENINENVISKSGILNKGYTKEIAFSKIKEARERLSQKMKAEKQEDFTTKYYALLIFDGDRMGEWLSGEKLADQSKLLEFHDKLSKSLHVFALHAKEILKEPHGKTVYAAGEDFLGFVNLNSLIDVLKELRQSFDEAVNKEIKKTFVFKPDTTDLTFSAGIAIAHYKQPLPTVLEEARSAEKKAKDAGGNRCCISIMRHSGGTTRCVLPFGTKTDSVELKQLNALDQIIEKIKDAKFSNTFIYQLIREMRIWQDVEERSMFEIEAKRLIERSSNHPKEKKKAAVIEFNEQFDMLTRSDSVNGLKKAELDNTFAILRIVDFIQRNLKGDTV